MFDLTGKRALVTGSTQGIGKEIAVSLARCGAEVIIHGSSNTEKCKRVVSEIEGIRSYAMGNLSEIDCAEKIYAQTGNVDILVLNASVQVRKKWDEITPEEFDLQMHVNLLATLMMIQKYVPYMKEHQWGRIVTLGSVQQYKPHKDMVVYAAGKCAQMSLVNNLAKQLALDGITVNNLSPGVIATPRNKTVLEDITYVEQVKQGIPIGRIGEGIDLGAAAVLFCSQEGRYITGTDLIVDGGMHL